MHFHHRISNIFLVYFSICVADQDARRSHTMFPRTLFARSAQDRDAETNVFMDGKMYAHANEEVNLNTMP